jgi:phosphoribosylglycinamide formyltransferase 1
MMPVFFLHFSSLLQQSFVFLNRKTNKTPITLKRIVVFASGSGTNARRIVEYFADNEAIGVEMILSNNPVAFVLERAKNLGIPAFTFDREMFYNTREVLKLLRLKKTDLIVLAGFLWLIPHYLIDAYRERIVNIHPALLPKYGGKGMFGDRVHQAVLAAGEQESGITIHYVDEQYDHGTVIFQHKCNIAPDETSESLAQKIHQLEYQYYPVIIEQLLL